VQDQKIMLARNCHRQMKIQKIQVDVVGRPFSLSFQKLQRDYFSSTTKHGNGIKNVVAQPRSPKKLLTNLILLRHGESIWNATPTFTGWCDIPLTETGMAQAMAAGKLLEDRGFSKFDAVYTSQLQRAVLTCHLALHFIAGQAGGFPTITRAWQLNERHYGALQGTLKKDPNLFKKYSKEDILSWRRGFREAPPPMDASHPYYLPPPAPLTESLKDCQERVVQYYKEVILPGIISSSNNTASSDKPANILVVAHSNTIRGLCTHLDEVQEENIPHIHIANSVPCVYQLETTIHENGRIDHEVVSPISSSKAGGSRAQWMFSKENYERLQGKLGSSESFARSIFDAWDTNGDGVLSREEIHNGLEELIDEGEHEDIAIAAIAGKVWEEIRLDSLEEDSSFSKAKKRDSEEFLTLHDFTRYIIRGCEKHNLLPFFAHR
jgi:2,3-bisphosphoglycerate-dependent phosphoglycerate mutase